MKLPFFTISHFNRSLEEFARLLTGANIGLVADIRKVPMSRANPQFNKDTLPEALAAFRVSYEHMAALGGLRGKARSLPPEGYGRFWWLRREAAYPRRCSPSPGRIRHGGG